jgi:hypothetical protein
MQNVRHSHTHAGLRCDGHSNMLYCALTGQLMDKSVGAVKVHMKGKKFIRNKGACLLSLFLNWPPLLVS